TLAVLGRLRSVCISAGELDVKASIARLASMRIETKETHDVAFDETASMGTMHVMASAIWTRPMAAMVRRWRVCDWREWQRRHGNSPNGDRWEEQRPEGASPIKQFLK